LLAVMVQRLENFTHYLYIADKRAISAYEIDAFHHIYTYSYICGSNDIRINLAVMAQGRIVA
jgi:hypothetical protein